MSDKQNLKYYIYISDTKIDMLYGQIPQEKITQVAKELSINLKIFKAGYSTTTKESEEQKFSKAKLVSKFIKENCRVGTVDKPDDYIYDKLEMRWGPYGYEGKFYADKTGFESPIVFFGGETDSTIIGMGGSGHHVIGATGKYNPHSASGTPILLSYLRKHLDIKLRQRDEWLAKDIEDEQRLYAVEFAVNEMRGPNESLEFLAKTLLTRRNQSGKLVILATPIYVAI